MPVSAANCAPFNLSRRTSQKPDDDLINKFKKTFPDVNSSGSLSGDGRPSGSINPAAVEVGIHGQFVFTPEVLRSGITMEC
jgi:hypothetical protein